MTLWLISTVMTSVAAVLVSAPFIRRFDRRHAQAVRKVEVYRDQLKEVENDAVHGIIDANQAQSARVEIKRRLLAADRAGDPSLVPLSRDERRFVLISVTGIVALGAVGL